MIIAIRLLKLCTAAVFVIAVFMSSSHASVNIIQADRYACSNGKNYDLLRSYSGGWGSSTWELKGMCSGGTLSSRIYDYIFLPENTHPEVKACMEEDTKALRFCFEEFKRLNGEKGVGEAPNIRHGRQTSPKRDGTIVYQDNAEGTF